MYGGGARLSFLPGDGLLAKASLSRSLRATRKGPWGNGKGAAPYLYRTFKPP